MSKIKGFFSFYGLVYTQVAASTILVALMELVFSRMDLSPTTSWQFYVLHLVLLIPCLLVMTPAGYFSDKYPKERVLLWTTVLSIPVSILAGCSVFVGNLAIAYVSLGLFFVLQAFQSPAKNGYMKELMGVRYLSTGSGILMIVTFVSIAISAWVTAFAFEKLVPSVADFGVLVQSLKPLAIATIALELIGFLFAYRLPAIGAYDESLKFPWNRYFTFAYARRKMFKSWRNRAVRQSIIGLSMFWVMIFLLVFVVQEQFSSGEILHHGNMVNFAIVGATLGLIVGVAYAMKMSKAFIETGLVPLGTAGSAILVFMIPFIPRPYNAIPFALLGFFAGVYMLPMLSLLLYNTKPRSAGHVLSIYNAVQNFCIIIFDALLIVAIRFWNFERMDLFYILGAVCLAGTIWALWALPQTMLRQLMRTLLSVHYKFIVRGLKHVPWEGPVLLLGNHVSYIDWALMQMASPRPLRIVICRQPFEKWYIRLLLSRMKVIDLDLTKPDDAMALANNALKNGEAVIMFPENSQSPTGKVMSFRLNYSKAIEGVENLKIVPFYIQGLWGSSYSNASAGYQNIVHSGGRVISIAFGRATEDSNPVQVKRLVQDLSITAWEAYDRQLRPVPNSWIRTAKRKKNSPVVFSPDGKHLSGYSLAAAALTFSRVFDKLTKGEKNVGVLIPPSGPGILVNMAFLIRGKTVSNLNYSSTPETMDYCCQLADVKTIVTAKLFVEKLKKKGIDMDRLLDKYKVYYMEDLAKKVKKSSLVANFLRVMLLPAWYLEMRFIKDVNLDDVATVIFSSGSEGKPKGVELTHLNLMGEIKQAAHDLNPGPEDVFLGILPLFHAFGFSITTMMCLVEGIPIATCPDPTDARLVGRICAQFKVSVMVATGTFLRMWGGSRHVHPLMFGHLRLIYAGAEKIREDVRTLFRTKFKIEIFEGFGCTETTPVAAVNTFDTLMDDYKTVQVGNKPGTVGTPLPGTQFRVVDPDTMEELPLGEDGLILIGGTQVMKGYLKDPERTEKALAIIDGHRWFKTGDKGHIDEDGFITIVDRYSRFAKLGGEMVSLGAVDFKISENPGFDAIEHFAVAVPDGAKGEKIALVYAGEPSEEELKKMLKEVGLPPLMLPSYVVKVESLPKLGSGKADVQTGKKMAIERLGLSNV